MINFKIDTCPRCGRKRELMLSNNPLSGQTICFDCIRKELDPHNLVHAEFFCRTYNLPWEPEIWIRMTELDPVEVFKEYTIGQLEKVENKPNLAYTSSTHDLWMRTNKEWEKCRRFTQILQRIAPIRDSYVERGRLKWGERYTFNEIISLDGKYTKTLKANNITNPIQKSAVQTLCKLQVEIDNAIAAGDAKAIKDYSAAWASFAKQADLENMINETKTDDITTVAELYDYYEKEGFKFKYFDGADKDEVDAAIKDIQDTNKRLILESTGLQNTLEDMMRQRMETVESEHAKNIAQSQTIQDLINFTPEDGEVETEDDADAVKVDLGDDFEEEEYRGPTEVI